MSLHPILDLALKNLVRHDVRHHGNRYNLFCDAFAQFGVAFPSLSPLGLGALCPRATLSTYEISNPTLQLWLAENDHLVSLQRQDLECLPWATIERSVLPMDEGMLGVEAQHIFKDERTMVSRFVFRNTGSGTLSIRPCWQGMISADRELYMLPYFIGASDTPRTSFLESAPAGIMGGLRNASPASDLPQVAIRLWHCGEGITVETRHPQYTFHSSAAVILAPTDSITFQFVTAIHFIAPGQSDFSREEPPEVALDFEALTASARSRFAQNINLEKAPSAASPSLALKAWRARYTLLRDGMRGMDGEFGDELACLCTADNTDFSCTFFWDTLFSSAAITDFHPHYAKGAIRTAFVRQDDRDGSSPERKFNYGPKQRMAQQSPQSPVASWAVREYLAQHEDPAFLAEMYPRLVRNHDFWKTYSDTDRDGLAEFRWSGQIGDNSPLWDQYAALDATTGCGWIPPVASVALNSFLFWDARHLAALAEMQGFADDAEGYRERAAQLERDLFNICYLPEEKRFWDFNHHTRTHRRVKTFYMFWPLFVGMNVPAETARDLIENVLLDPAQFFGEIPFPSVAYDEPSHDSKGYWRGRTWPHISYWLLQTLVRHGYVDEAKEAARRILSAHSRSAGFPENIAAHVRDFEAAGFADYNWGCAAVYLIATNHYLQVSHSS